jgi:endonuclease V-like protein UPF0215 family
MASAPRHFPHVVGFDDAPFDRNHRGDVCVIGAVYAGDRLDGVLSGKVRRDGANATRVVAELVQGSRFYSHLQLVLLQGIALAGFNVVDIHALHRRLALPVAVVARQAPDLPAIHEALLQRVRGGRRKWRLIERAGPMEAIAGVYVQRAGLSAQEAARMIGEHARHGAVPEPLRSAHIIAGGVVRGESRRRV